MKQEQPTIKVSKTNSGIIVYFNRSAMEFIKTKEIVIKTAPILKVSLPSVDSSSFYKITNSATHIYGFPANDIYGIYLIEGEGEDCFLLEKIEN